MACHFIESEGEGGVNELNCGVGRLRVPEMVAGFIGMADGGGGDSGKGTTRQHSTTLAKH